MKISGCFFRGNRCRRIEFDSDLRRSLVIFFAFAAGGVAGALLGSSSSAIAAVEGVILSDGGVYSAGSFPELFAFGMRYPALIFLFSVSLTGVLFVPCVMFLRGFAMACTSYSIAVAYSGSNGILLSAVIVCLPALFSVPGLFLLARAGLGTSQRLLALWDRKPAPEHAGFIGAVFFSVLSVAAAAAIQYYVVTDIVRFLT